MYPLTTQFTGHLEISIVHPSPDDSTKINLKTPLTFRVKVTFKGQPIRDAHVNFYCSRKKWHFYMESGLLFYKTFSKILKEKNLAKIKMDVRAVKELYLTILVSVLVISTSPPIIAQTSAAQITYVNTSARYLIYPSDYVAEPSQDIIIRVGVKNIGTTDLHLRVVLEIWEILDAYIVYNSTESGEDKEIRLSEGEHSSLIEFQWTVPSRPDTPAYKVLVSIKDWDDPSIIYDFAKGPNVPIIHVPFDNGIAIMNWVGYKADPNLFNNENLQFLIKTGISLAIGAIVGRLVNHIAGLVGGIFLDFLLSAKLAGWPSSIDVYGINLLNGNIEKQMSVYFDDSVPIIIFLETGDLAGNVVVTVQKRVGDSRQTLTSVTIPLYSQPNKGTLVGSYHFCLKTPFTFKFPGEYYISASFWEYRSEVKVTVTSLESIPIDLALVLDRSGSMGETMGVKTKMDGAKESAIAVINALMFGDRVAVISFSSFGTVNAPLTDDFEHAKNEIMKLSASGTTSFGAGLSLAVNELKVRGDPKHAWAILFMSDGWHNTAPGPEPYVEECRSLGIPIYTIGLGRTSSDVNEVLLKWMASETGGKYLFAPTLYDLQNVFVKFSLEVAGWKPIAEFTGRVFEGEIIEAGTVYVAPSTLYVRITLNWPSLGSDLDLVVVRPDGSQVDLNWGIDNIYSGSTAKPEWVILLFPQAGTWIIKVYGKKINSPDEQFAVWVSEYNPPLLPKLDNIPPTTTLNIGEPKYVSLTGKLYVTSATQLTLTAEDNPEGTGVASTFYRIYNSTYDTGWLKYSAPFYLIGLADGEYSIDYYSVDNVGNTEPTNTITVFLDNTPPDTTLTIGEPKYTSDTVYVTPDTPFTLEAIDVGSGIFSIAYRIFNSDYDSGWQTYTGTFNLAGLADGAYTIEFNSTDNLGNVEATNSVQVTLFSWNYVFEDSYGRGTILKINLAHKFFQFITPDKDYGIRKATYMRQCGRTIIIKHCDDELRLITIALDTKLDFCIATAWDKQAKKHYLLLDKVGKE